MPIVIKSNRKNHIIVIMLSIVSLLGCSSGEQKAKKTQKEEVLLKKDKGKASVSSTKPKTSKSLSSLEPISDDKNNREIKIIPIGDPVRGLRQIKDEEKVEPDENEQPDAD